MKMVTVALLVLLPALLAGCGSGGSGGTAVNTVTPGGGTTATIELSTATESNESIIYGVEMALRLPSGVTVPADPSTGEVQTGVLQVRDAGALVGGRYIPATSATQAQVRINITDPTGFTVGALGTVTCQVAAGVTVDAGGFTLEGFSARDANGAVIPAITGHLALKR